MYTVFIADDESKVINGLINRIHWDILEQKKKYWS